MSIIDHLKKNIFKDSYFEQTQQVENIQDIDSKFLQRPFGIKNNMTATSLKYSSLDQHSQLLSQQLDINSQQAQFTFISHYKKTSKCVVCNLKNAKYTCPRCLIRYCSGKHYKTHNLFCSENFFRQQLENKLKKRRVSAKQREVMITLLKQNVEQSQKDQLQLINEVQVEYLNETRLNQILELIQAGKEISLSNRQSKLFQEFIKDQHNTPSFPKQEQTQNQQINVQQYTPFWQNQDGLHNYFAEEIPSQNLQQHYHSKHQQTYKTIKPMAEERKIIAGQLKRILPTLKEKIKCKKTSIFVNIQLIQIIYIQALLFRTLNGQISNNPSFLSFFLHFYDQNFAKRFSEMVNEKQKQAQPSQLSRSNGLIKAIKAMDEINNPINLIKWKMSYQIKNMNIGIDLFSSWFPIVCSDMLVIFSNQHKCIQSLFRLYRALIQHESNIYQQKQYNNNYVNHKRILKLIKKIQFLMVFSSQIIYGLRLDTSQQNIQENFRSSYIELIKNIVKRCWQQQLSSVRLGQKDDLIDREKQILQIVRLCQKGGDKINNNKKNQSYLT